LNRAILPPSDCALAPIGVVVDVAGSGSGIALDLHRLEDCMDDADPTVALSGQVGSQIKVRVGGAGCSARCATSGAMARSMAARWRSSISGRG
jgi:hypothetical protein